MIIEKKYLKHLKLVECEGYEFSKENNPSDDEMRMLKELDESYFETHGVHLIINYTDLN
jgi:hypothetical protein